MKIYLKLLNPHFRILTVGALFRNALFQVGTYYLPILQLPLPPKYAS